MSKLFLGHVWQRLILPKYFRSVPLFVLQFPEISVPQRDTDRIKMFQQRLGIFSAGVEQIAHLTQADFPLLLDLLFYLIQHEVIVLFAKNYIGRHGDELALFHGV